MNEAVLELEKQLELAGVIALDRMQAEKLILYIKALLLAVQQQDMLIQKLKQLAKV